MSINLDVVDLSSLSIGSSGSITIKPPGFIDPIGNGPKGHISLFNESGSGLQISFSDGRGDFMPAGGWAKYELGPSSNSIIWTVLYNLPNPPVTKLIPVYYYPGEKVPDMPILGNSPIGIGGTVNTSSIQTLSNESSPPTPILVIDIGNTSISQLVKIYNDGKITFNVMQSGVSHQVINTQTSGKPLQLGAGGDHTEVLGVLDVDDRAFVNGDIETTGKLINPAGTVRGIQNLGTPYQFKTNATVSTGTTTVTIAGNGGIPSNAAGVFVACDGVSASAGAYVQMGPQGFSGGQSSWPSLYETQINNNTSVGNGYIPLNTSNGQLDIKVFNAQMTSFNAYVYAYIA